MRRWPVPAGRAAPAGDPGWFRGHATAGGHLDRGQRQLLGAHGDVPAAAAQPRGSPECRSPARTSAASTPNAGRSCWLAGFSSAPSIRSRRRTTPSPAAPGPWVFGPEIEAIAGGRWSCAIADALPLHGGRRGSRSGAPCSGRCFPLRPRPRGTVSGRRGAHRPGSADRPGVSTGRSTARSTCQRSWYDLRDGGRSHGQRSRHRRRAVGPDPPPMFARRGDPAVRSGHAVDGGAPARSARPARLTPTSGGMASGELYEDDGMSRDTSGASMPSPATRIATGADRAAGRRVRATGSRVRIWLHGDGPRYRTN